MQFLFLNHILDAIYYILFFKFFFGQVFQDNFINVKNFIQFTWSWFFLIANSGTHSNVIKHDRMLCKSYTPKSYFNLLFEFY